MRIVTTIKKERETRERIRWRVKCEGCLMGKERGKENDSRRYFFIICVTSFSVLEYRISNPKENIKIRL